MHDDLEDDHTVIGQLKRDAVLEGYVQGTEAFDHKVRQLQVSKCREMRGHSSCSECQFFDYCDLVKRLMRDNRGIE